MDCDVSKSSLDATASGVADATCSQGTHVCHQVPIDGLRLEIVTNCVQRSLTQMKSAAEPFVFEPKSSNEGVGNLARVSLSLRQCKLKFPIWVYKRKLDAFSNLIGGRHGLIAKLTSGSLD
ncbi:hypothetical protein CEXT_583541 [Caerostris extrusa]|uniref:Uncharacterized protein n=1 Tax=Caerostris extrusa TaxID=172846 RepID=A0AAV4NNX4_CAEEX|nr:hypothetical protein CEXT_583541 [Caerostris extrusa]